MRGYHNPKSRHKIRGGQVRGSTDGVTKQAGCTLKPRQTKAKSQRTKHVTQFKVVQFNANGLDFGTMACLLGFAQDQGYPDVICVQETKSLQLPTVGFFPYSTIHFDPILTDTNEIVGGTAILVHKRWTGQYH